MTNSKTAQRGEGPANMAVAARAGFSTHTIERAFELAASGRCASIEDIRRQLTREDFPSVHAHLAGTVIKQQLKSCFPPRRRRRSAGSAAPDASARPDRGAAR